jgi:hypothetical protein
VNAIAAGLVAALSLAAPSVAAPPALHGFGLRLVLPRGWYGELYRRPGDEPVLHAATFPLPGADDDTASKAARALGTNDILVVLLEQRPTARGFSYNPARPPIRIVRGNFLRRPATHHALARRTFSLNDRKFRLFVYFGSRQVSTAQLRRANRLLLGFSSATPP